MGEAIGNTKPRQEPTVPNIYAIILRYVAVSAYIHIAIRRIEPAQAFAVVTVAERVTLPTHAQIQGEFRSHLPLVTHVPGPLIPAQRIRVEGLVDFARFARQTQQEIGDRVEISRGRSLQRRNGSVEPETAAGRLEGATLWLEMVKLCMVPLNSAANVVPSVRPTQVCATHELVIAEQVRVAGIGVSEIHVCRGGLDLECRQAVVKEVVVGIARAVCSRDLQQVEPLWGAEIERRSESLPSVAEVPVDQQIGSKGVGSAETHALNQARSIAELAAVRRVTPGVSQQGRIEHENPREAVAGEYHGFLRRHVVDLDVGIVAVE